MKDIFWESPELMKWRESLEETKEKIVLFTVQMIVLLDRYIQLYSTVWRADFNEWSSEINKESIFIC